MAAGDGPVGDDHPVRTNPIAFVLAAVGGFGLLASLHPKGWLWWVTLIIGGAIGFGIGKALEDALPTAVRRLIYALAIIAFWTAIIVSCSISD